MILETLTGKGSFYYGNKSFETDFKIVFYPLQTFVEIDVVLVDGFFNHSWSLKGLLSNGIIVESNKLFPVNFGELQAIDLSIGDKTNVVNVSSFPLVGFYYSNISLKYDGYEIVLAGDSKVEDEKEYYQRVGTIREGIILNLKKPNHTIEEALNKISSITALLSFATGNNVIFNKGNFDNSYTVYFRQVPQSSSFSNIVPYGWMGKFLEDTLLKWENLGEDDRKLIRNITSYLNFAGSSEYLDERIFRLAQAWEMAATKWGRRTATPSEEILNLRSRLKKVWKEWRSDYPDADANGFINSRILRSLEWNSFMNSIDNLVDYFKIDTTKIELNFKLLKDKVRDKVAHEGKMIPFDDAYILLDELRFGLRLIILSKLGYKGDVLHHQHGYTRNFRIQDFFILDKNQIEVYN